MIWTEKGGKMTSRRKEMKYKACLFDLYGTLMDVHTDESLPILWKTMASWYQKQGAAYTPQSLQREYLIQVKIEAKSVKNRFALQGISITWPEPEIGNVFRSLFRAKGVFAEEEMIRTTASLFRRTCRLRLRPYAGAAQLLKSLKQAGMQVDLLSNAQRLYTEEEMRNSGLYDLFDHVFISSDFGVKKPDPHFFEEALKKTGFAPEDCLMIGNDLACDIEGALSAGMAGYYIFSNLSPKEDGEKEIPNGCGYQKGMDLKLTGKRILNGLI